MATIIQAVVPDGAHLLYPVVVPDADGRYFTFGPGDTVPDWAKVKITNQSAWDTPITLTTVTTGLTGPQGPKGDKGDAGSLGSPGPVGATGLQGPVGATGAAGAAGVAGAAGAQGPAGVAGVAGPAGAAGATGAAGAGIAIAGNRATYAALPSNLTSGDAGKGYLVDADGLLYIWSGTAFPANGSGVAFRGPTGPTGAQGVQGIQGSTGAAGATGATGTTGATGAQGAQGATGPQPSLASSAPAALAATATAGVATTAARADHAHVLPAPADIGAYTKPGTGIPQTDLDSATSAKIDAATVPSPFVHLIKAAGETRNTTTKTTDNTLFFTPDVNATYLFAFMLHLTGSTTGQFQGQLVGPSSGATVRAYVNALPLGATVGTAGISQVSLRAFNSVFSAGTPSASTPTVVVITGTLKTGGTVDGPFGLSWAQNAVDTTTLTNLFSGSELTASKTSG